MWRACTCANCACAWARWKSNVQLLPETRRQKVTPVIVYSAAYISRGIKTHHVVLRVSDLVLEQVSSCSTVVTARQQNVHPNRRTATTRIDARSCSIDDGASLTLGLHGRIMGGGASSDERPPHASSPHAGTPHRPLRTLGQARRMWRSRRKECAVHIMRLE